MTRDEALKEIKTRWRDLYPTDKKGKGIICPLCGSGSGKNGTGISSNEKNGKPYSLKCFKCGFSGDVLDLIQADYKTDLHEALNIAAGKLNISLEASEAPYNADTGARSAFNNKMDKMADKDKKTPTAAPQSVTDYTSYYKVCKNTLEDDKKASDAILYLINDRKISLDTAERFYIGYDAAWISPTVAKKYESEGNPWRPDPSKRIIVPISNNHYLARAIDKDAPIQKMNETGGGSVCFFNIKALKRPNNAIFIVEGVFDALSILEAGAEAIAINSTSNARLFIEKLQQEQPIDKTLILCLDKDEAGTKGTETLKQGLKKLNVRFIEADICGDENDANDALIKDRNSFLKAINEALKAAEPPNEIDLFLNKIKSEAYKPYKTGLKFFDELMGGGLTMQTLTIIMAAPGAGKTTLCQQLARSIVKNQKRNVIYLNLEMSREQMIAKDISAILCDKGVRKTTLDILQGYQWGADEEKCITDTIKEYKETINPYLKYNPGNLAGDLESINSFLEAQGKKAKAAGKPAPAVILDYLHLVRDKGTLDIQEIIKHVIEVFKNYAKNYDTFVIAISATNREANKSGNITLESGRDSSNIEYTADNVISLNYSEMDMSKSNKPEAAKLEMIKSRAKKEMVLRLLKSRFSIPGQKKKVYFNSAYNIFYSGKEPTDPAGFREMEAGEDNPFSMDELRK